MNAPLTVLHVGCGKMAPAWLEPAAARADLRLAGLVDLQPEAAAALRDRFAPGAEAGGDFGEMLARLRPDVVFNCTVPAAHHAISRQSLEAGAHVLSEKPLANTMEEARDLVRAATAAKRVLAVTQNYRYAAAARTIRTALHGGAIGEMTDVLCDFFVGAHFGGFRDEMEHVLLHDMAIHQFDLARFFAGRNPTRVFCQEWNPRGSWYRHGANAHTIFTFEGGLVFNYRGSWCAEGTPTPWNGVWRFIGTRGTLLWDGLADLRLQAATPNGKFFSDISVSQLPVVADQDAAAGHASLIAEFVRAVRADRQPETHAADNVHSLGMVFGAIESARLDRPVGLS